MSDIGHRDHTSSLAAAPGTTTRRGPAVSPPDILVFLLIAAQIWGPLAAGAFLHG